jgi:phosphoserine phosphatase
MSQNKNFDLIGFDVDGTLVRHPTGRVIWEVLNLRYGGSEEINRDRYDSYHRGDLAYDKWVELDIGGWQAAGATRDEILESVDEFELVGGAWETVHELKKRGFKLAVISGTLDILLDHLFPDHPFDEVYTNKIFFNGDGTVESWRATPFDGHGKPRALRDIAERHGVPLSRSAFVGDGENDVPLLDVSGFFVAYQPKSTTLETRADVVIRDDGLHALLDVFK